MSKYLLTSEDETVVLTDRPTQAEIKEKGVGTYTLRREDGSVIKNFLVVVNRKNGLSITSTTPEGLEGVTSLHLGRLLKAYDTVVKYWPAKTNDRKRVAAEIAKRDELLIATIR